jgi:hypothetical protein
MLSAINGILNSPPPTALNCSAIISCKILLTFNKQGSIRITEVNEFPNATYFEKLATPAVKGKPSES